MSEILYMAALIECGGQSSLR